MHHFNSFKCFLTFNQTYEGHDGLFQCTPTPTNWTNFLYLIHKVDFGGSYPENTVRLGEHRVGEHRVFNFRLFYPLIEMVVNGLRAVGQLWIFLAGPIKRQSEPTEPCITSKLILNRFVIFGMLIQALD